MPLEGMIAQKCGQELDFNLYSLHLIQVQELDRKSISRNTVVQHSTSRYLEGITCLDATYPVV